MDEWEQILSYNAHTIKVVNGDKRILAQKKYNDFIRQYMRDAKDGGIVDAGAILCRKFFENQSHTIDFWKKGDIIGIRLEGFDWCRKRLMVYLSIRYTIP